jgi:HAD superfamily hydrolase (TIGR01549 family)
MAASEARSARQAREGPEWLGRPVRAVTFDCWSTLIHEEPESVPRIALEEALAAAARELRVEISLARAGEALSSAWARHTHLWRRGIASGAVEMARWALEDVGAPAPERAVALGAQFETITAQAKHRALPGAQHTLRTLAERGVRRALICDTGMSSGQSVRRYLDRLGLLEWLEVLVFSDEAGVPKPHPKVFHVALEGLGVAPEAAIHVGDLRRSDVAGARGVGMGSVRIRAHNDDASEHPDADAVVDSHADLCRLLGLSAPSP